MRYRCVVKDDSSIFIQDVIEDELYSVDDLDIEELNYLTKFLDTKFTSEVKVINDIKEGRLNIKERYGIRMFDIRTHLFLGNEIIERYVENTKGTLVISPLITNTFIECRVENILISSLVPKEILILNNENTEIGVKVKYPIKSLVISAKSALDLVVSYESLTKLNFFTLVDPMILQIEELNRNEQILPEELNRNEQLLPLKGIYSVNRIRVKSEKFDMGHLLSLYKCMIPVSELYLGTGLYNIEVWFDFVTNRLISSTVHESGDILEWLLAKEEYKGDITRIKLQLFELVYDNCNISDINKNISYKGKVYHIEYAYRPHRQSLFVSELQ